MPNISAYIQCDACQLWYHFQCMGLENNDRMQDDDNTNVVGKSDRISMSHLVWLCPICIKVNGVCDTPLTLEGHPVEKN